MMRIPEATRYNIPLHHPLLLAIQWAGLDVVCGGWTMLVVCNGGSAKVRAVLEAGKESEPQHAGERI
jgi:hypothetical protein